MAVKAWVIPWYRKQDWPDWQAMFGFKGSFEEWLARAEPGAKHHERLGYNVAKVVIEPRAFLDWKKANVGIVDGEARIAYAVGIFEQRAKDGNG